jgi:aryl-alcohol dehydrogenase-like predicted oxidoreductase
MVHFVHRLRSVVIEFLVFKTKLDAQPFVGINPVILVRSVRICQANVVMLNDDSLIQKLGLGTAQFGLDYGVSNNEGRTPPAEVKQILRLASEQQITLLDTAAAYGSSESILGQFHNGAFKIVTKVNANPSSLEGVREWMQASVKNSLARLDLRSIYALLLHLPADRTFPNDSVISALKDMREKGFCQNIGVSAYSACQIEKACRHGIADVVQIPLSILDQRLVQSGHLELLRQSGSEVHARSVFLQGLLLMPPSSLPSYFSKHKAVLHDYHQEVGKRNLSSVAVALSFVLRQQCVDFVICGVNNAAQLKELVQITKKPLPEEVLSAMSALKSDDADLLEPARWLTDRSPLSQT